MMFRVGRGRLPAYGEGDETQQSWKERQEKVIRQLGGEGLGVVSPNPLQGARENLLPAKRRFEIGQHVFFVFVKQLECRVNRSSLAPRLHNLLGLEEALGYARGWPASVAMVSPPSHAPYGEPGGDARPCGR